MHQENKFNFKYLFKVIVYLFALLIAIYLVLLASGYKFDFSRKNFVMTGNIYINSNPKDVKIYINGKLRSTRTPFKLGYLLPGDYQVKIEKESYKSWEKNLTIKPGLVTSEPEIILFYNKNIELAFSQIEGILGMKINKNMDELLYFTDKDIYFQKTDSDQYQKSENLAESIIENVIGTANFEKIVIKKKGIAEGISTFIYCPDRNCKEPYDLNRGLNLNFEKAKLTNDDNYPLLLSAQGNLYSIKNDYSKYYIDTKVLDYEYYNGKIYYLADKENGVGLSYSNADGSEKKEITIQKSLTNEKNNFSLNLDMKKNRLYLIGESQNLYMINSGSQSLDDIGTKASSLNFENKNFLLITNGSELKVQGKVELTDEEKSLHQIARYSQNIINAGWLLQTNHILFIRDKILKTVEVKGKNETDLYSYLGDGATSYTAISKNEVIVLDNFKLKKLTICDKGSLIDFW